MRIELGMRNLFRKFLPSHDSVKNQRWLKPFGSLLQHPNLWHLHRRSVSGGVAVGLFCGLIPGPLQMISAALLAVLLRVNLPVAAFTTLYTNPFTIVPLYMAAYELGAWFSGARSGKAVGPSGISGNALAELAVRIVGMDADARQTAADWFAPACADIGDHRICCGALGVACGGDVQMAGQKTTQGGLIS